MNIKVSNEIYITNPAPEIQAWAEKYLVIDNPEYFKKVKLGKWTGNTPQNIWLYEKRSDGIVIPFGCFQKIWELYPDKSAYTCDIKPIEARRYKSLITLYPYQENAAEAIIRAKNGILVMPCGSGKGLPLDAKIYTPSGYKLNGDLKVGDEIIGSNGNPIKVTGIYDRGIVNAYKITFSDEKTVVCDKDHLWTVQKQTQRADSGKWWTESTEQIYKHYQNIKRQDLYYIPIVKPVKFAEKPITINPWLLGFLIGDGYFDKMISFSTNEQDLIDRIKNISSDEVKYKGKYDYYFKGKQIYNVISELNLIGKRSLEKYIPEQYKYNSIDVRLSVLQGLFDADGYNSGKGIYEYSTSSKQLANDIIEIIESLGGTAKVRVKKPLYTYKGEKRRGKTNYRIFFKLYRFDPFTSEKHKAKKCNRTYYANAYRIIKKIEPVDPIISRCITVDADDELYVTDHFIVTHNTQTGLEVIARIGGRALWLTHTQDLFNQSYNRAKSVLEIDGTFGKITDGKVDIGTHVTFATVQTMCNIDLPKYKDCFDVVIVDECLPGNTKIITENGEKDLKNLLKGDIIVSYNRHNKKFEKKRVTHLFKYKAHDIVKVKLENGEEIVATKNHPFYTSDDKWVNAENLGGNDYVMCLVQTGVRRNDETENNAKQNKKTWVRILLQRMFDKSRTCKRCVDGRTPKKIIGNDEAHKREISRSVCGTYETKQSDEKYGCKTISIKKIERDWASSENQMRQRSGIDCTTTEFDGCISEESNRDICRISDTDKNAERKRLSDVLQGRYCSAGVYGRGRGRRKFALCNSKTRAGREKRQFFEWVRVASVEIQKSTSDGTFGGLCEDGFVYNIEVEDNNNYFANGVLVHNCQHCCGTPTRVTQFYKVVSSLAARYKIGLTATPKRSDGLERSMFAILGSVAYEVTRQDVKDTTCEVRVRQVDTGYVPDYNAVLCADGTLDYSAIVNDMIHNEARFEFINDYINGLSGSKIVLANRVEYIQRLCNAYNGRAVCLSGAGQSKRAKEERKAALQKLNNGDLDAIFASYKLAAEGLDCPNLKYLVMATPEKDPTIIQQSTGRVSRKGEAKDRGIVVDFVDRFGMYKGWAKKRRSIYNKLGYGMF